MGLHFDFERYVYIFCANYSIWVPPNALTCYIYLATFLRSSSILLLLVLGVTNILDSVRCILLIKVARNVGIMGHEHDWAAFLTTIYRTAWRVIHKLLRLVLAK